MILFNPATQPARYIPPFFKEPATYDDFVYRLEWYNLFVDAPQNMSFEQKVYVLAVNLSFFQINKSKDAQYIIIVPEGKTITAIIDKYKGIMGEGLTPAGVPVWISSTLTTTKQGNADFFVVQGYRSRKFPCPQLLISLAQAPPQMSPAAATLYPEWSSRDRIAAWLTDVLREWYADILSMRTETVDDRDRRDTQLRLWYHVVVHIPKDSAQPLLATAAIEEAKVAHPDNTGRRGRLAANVAALAAAANTVDPNLLYERIDTLKGTYSNILAENLKERPAVRSLVDPLPRRRRGWFTGETKEAYRRTIKARIDLFRQMYGAPTAPSANSSRADTLTMILNQGTDARAAWAAFKSWREAELRLFDGTTDPALVAEINTVGPKGFFTGTATYMRRLQGLLRRFYGLSGGRHRKSRAFSRKQMARSRSSRRKTQRGGGAPLAYYQQGAQMFRTSADPTGAGMTTTNSTWARTPLPRQSGGWLALPPSAMGSFVANGGRLLPVAAYMGYRQTRSQQHRRRRRTHRKRGKI
jgi:hypothetical protein